jgi:hypothetical protein
MTKDSGTLFYENNKHCNGTCCHYLEERGRDQYGNHARGFQLRFVLYIIVALLARKTKEIIIQSTKS